MRTIGHSVSGTRGQHGGTLTASATPNQPRAHRVGAALHVPGMLTRSHQARKPGANVDSQSLFHAGLADGLDGRPKDSLSKFAMHRAEAQGKLNGIEIPREIWLGRRHQPCRGSARESQRDPYDEVGIVAKNRQTTAALLQMGTARALPCSVQSSCSCILLPSHCCTVCRESSYTKLPSVNHTASQHLITSFLSLASASKRSSSTVGSATPLVQKMSNLSPSVRFPKYTSHFSICTQTIRLVLIIHPTPTIFPCRPASFHRQRQES